MGWQKRHLVQPASLSRLIWRELGEQFAVSCLSTAEHDAKGDGDVLSAVVAVTT